MFLILIVKELVSGIKIIIAGGITEEVGKQVKKKHRYLILVGCVLMVLFNK